MKASQIEDVWFFYCLYVFERLTSFDCIVSMPFLKQAQYSVAQTLIIREASYTYTCITVVRKLKGNWFITLWDFLISVTVRLTFFPTPMDDVTSITFIAHWRHILVSCKVDAWNSLMQTRLLRCITESFWPTNYNYLILAKICLVIWKFNNEFVM